MAAVAIARRQRAPPAAPVILLSYPISPPSMLIVAFFKMFSSRFRRRRILIFIFFVPSFSAAIRLQNIPPPHTHSATVAHPLRCPPSPRASFSGLLLLCFYWRPPNAWAPPPSLFRDMSRFGTHRAPPVPPSSYRPIPSPVRRRHSFFVDCCVFLQRFAAV